MSLTDKPGHVRLQGMVGKSRQRRHIPSVVRRVALSMAQFLADQHGIIPERFRRIRPPETTEWFRCFSLISKNNCRSGGVVASG